MDAVFHRGHVHLTPCKNVCLNVIFNIFIFIFTFIFRYLDYSEDTGFYIQDERELQ